MPVTHTQHLFIGRTETGCLPTHRSLETQSNGSWHSRPWRPVAVSYEDGVSVDAVERQWTLEQTVTNKSRVWGCPLHCSGGKVHRRI